MNGKLRSSDGQLRVRLFSLVAGLIAGWVSVVSSCQELAAQPMDFSRDIRPILTEHCFACHGPDEESREAGLRLDRREDAVDYGAIDDEHPENSEVLARVFSDDPGLVMPPEGTKQLTQEEKDSLQQWIVNGAQYEKHWAFVAPTKSAPPAVESSEWVRNEIDRFVLAQLEDEGLEPAPPAEPRRLFRRLHLDITGLPPAPRDVESFVASFEAHGEEALSDWIDKLMSKPAWGEHRARYWLDAARYGDTHGLHFDNYREMWPYRDWVIRSFNDNQPFDEFTVEQIAGDLLPDPTVDQLIATGFQRCNITTNEGGTIDEENLANYATDRVQTIGWVYLGLTTNCAQCHDHKFDPLTMEDYYSLAAFFRNTTQGPKDGNVKDGKGPILVVPSKSDEARWNELPGLIADAEALMKDIRREAKDDYERWLESSSPDQVRELLPSEQLLLHLPLRDGVVGEAAAEDDSQGDSDESPTSADQETHKTEENADGEKQDDASELRWTDEGKLGPALLIEQGRTLKLDSLGDFEKDQEFSYGAWIKAGGNNVSGGIIARMDERNGYRGWDLYQEKRRLAVHLIHQWPDNGVKVSTRRNVLRPGKWQHVFVTYDGSGKPGGIKIYVDGAAQPLKTDTASLKSEASIRTDTPLRIGQRSHGQLFEGGAIQDVRLYARSLATAEVKQIANLTVLEQILAKPADQRNAMEKGQLFDHYLTHVHAGYQTAASRHKKLTQEQNRIRERSPITHIQEEREDSMPTAHVLMRGQYDRPGDEVAAAPPSALHALPDDAPGNRLGLAEWLIDPANPLTTRVTVNRFWQQLFGQGIVTTVENFGLTGARPSHPELLDWLAVDFRESGWDVKALFKRMLMSATYRQSAITTPEKLERDRDNALLSRGPRFRMDAEMVRDYALAASGLLSCKMYGPGTKPYQPENIWNIVGLPSSNTRDYEQDHGEDLYRRSVYMFWKRMAPPPSLEAFNAPSREVCTVTRERTNTPLQALVTLNDPQFVEAARRLAERAMAAGEGDDLRTMQFISEAVLCRPLTTPEQSVVQANFENFLHHYNSHQEDARRLVTVGESKVSSDFSQAELAAWTMVSNQILNLDETLNK